MLSLITVSFVLKIGHLVWLFTQVASYSFLHTNEVEKKTHSCTLFQSCDLLYFACFRAAFLSPRSHTVRLRPTIRYNCTYGQPASSTYLQLASAHSIVIDDSYKTTCKVNYVSRSPPGSEGDKKTASFFLSSDSEHYMEQTAAQNVACSS